VRAISHYRSAVRSSFLVALLAGFLTFAGSTNVHARVSAEERQALIDFYQATGGDDWDDNAGWLAEAGSECNWFGVQCAGQQSGTPFILRLMLPGNNLVGRLPDSLAGLNRLISLVVSDNELTGSISPNLWGLPSLEGLFLSQTQFSGPVPAAILAMAEGMPHTRVELSGNMLDGFDITAMAVVATPVAAELRLSPDQLGWVFSFALAGMMAGAMLLAPISDLVGRRALIIGSVALVGVSILLTANASTLPEFIVLRFVSGMGAGAMLACQATLAAEYSPDRYRAIGLGLLAAASGRPRGSASPTSLGRRTPRSARPSGRHRVVGC